MIIQAPVSLGELIDKITILEIKMERIKDQVKHANVSHELQLLEAILKPIWSQGMALFRTDLKTVNESLWDVEDELRLKDQRGEFDDAFIKLAQSVYVTNDRRAALKYKVNTQFGSAVIEEKSYA